MDQLFRMSDVLAPAVDALLGELEGERRRARMRYAQSGELGGRFGDILRGWRGQAELIRARLMKEVLATRLDSSEGPELRDLAKSEYFAELPTDSRKAVGEAVLTRSVVNTSPATSGNFGLSVIPAGTRIRRTVSKAPRVPQPDAEWVTTVDVTCPDTDSGGTDVGVDSTTHFQKVTVPIVATREGPHANLPTFPVAGLGIERINPRYGTVDGAIAGVPFAANEITSAGGTLGVVDDQIRALARALALGSGGPTGQAMVAGALTNAGVRRAVYVENPAAATGLLYIGDESWASSQPHLDAVLNELLDYPWIGWGCRVRLRGVKNVGITVSPTVVLRRPENEAAASDITDKIAAALREYFAERPDWWTWTLNAIGATVGAADDRILACTAVAIYDDLGAPIAAIDAAEVITGAEPPPTINPNSEAAPHYVLLDRGVDPIFQLPGQS
jgi:hypothetical protein